MNESPDNKIGRNDPCPCGSGKKYKNCCAQASPITDRRQRSKLLGIGLIVLVVAAAVSAAVWFGPGGGLTPEPWQYDAANDRHWHPEHGHWHQGPPPGQAAGGNTPGAGSGTRSGIRQQPQNAGASPAGGTPEPWEYDRENNQHWHPDHGHWHQGPPPPEGQRGSSGSGFGSGSGSGSGLGAGSGSGSGTSPQAPSPPLRR